MPIRFSFSAGTTLPMKASNCTVQKNFFNDFIFNNFYGWLHLNMLRKATGTQFHFLSVFRDILISFHSGVSVAGHFSGLSAGECLPPPHSTFASLRRLRFPPLLNQRNDTTTSPISLHENRMPPEHFLKKKCRADCFSENRSNVAVRKNDSSK